MNRSQSTTFPAATAGRINCSTWSLRAAAKSTASIRTPNSSAPPDSKTCRTASAPGEPPGSRVATTSRPSPRSVSASSLIWVDLPTPSPPSKVMKRPTLPSRPTWRHSRWCDRPGSVRTRIRLRREVGPPGLKAKTASVPVGRRERACRAAPSRPRPLRKAASPGSACRRDRPSVPRRAFPWRRAP